VIAVALLSGACSVVFLTAIGERPSNR